MTAPIPVPTGPIENEPITQRVMSDDDLRQMLLDELADARVTLGAYDSQIVAWLSRWGTGAVTAVASWVRRSRTVAASTYTEWFCRTGAVLVKGSGEADCRRMAAENPGSEVVYRTVTVGPIRVAGTEAGQ